MSDRSSCGACGRAVPGDLLSCVACGAPRLDAPSPRSGGVIHPLAAAAVALSVVGLPVAASSLPLPVLPSILGIWLAGRSLKEIRSTRGSRARQAPAHAARWLGVSGLGVRIARMFWIEINQPLLILIFAFPALLGALFWVAVRSPQTLEEMQKRRARLPWDR